jgi:3-(3-hydroxy-phenyl)propionate hydroxylase
MGADEHAVVIAGGGPTGMMPEAELAPAGVDAVIVERREARWGSHARTIEVLDQPGVGERFVSQGQVAQVAGVGGVTLDMIHVPTRRPYGPALWQKRFEEIVAELDVPTRGGKAGTCGWC